MYFSVLNKQNKVGLKRIFIFSHLFTRNISVSEKFEVTVRLFGEANKKYLL